MRALEWIFGTAVERAERALPRAAAEGKSRKVRALLEFLAAKNGTGYLRSCFNHPADAVRLAALEILTSGNDYQSEEIIRFAGSEWSPRLRERAIILFIEKARGGALAELLRLQKLLRSPSTYVVHHPAEEVEQRYEPADMALATYWTETIPAHDQQVHDDPDAGLRRAIDEALMRLGHPT